MKEYKCFDHGYGWLVNCNHCQSVWRDFIKHYPIHDTNFGRLPEPIHMDDIVARKLGLGKYQHQRWVDMIRAINKENKE